MSNIWKFSSLSEPYIEKWIKKAITIENNNKWSEQFKHVTKTCLDEHNVKKTNEEFVSEVIIDEEMAIVENAMDTSILKEEVQTKIHDETFCNLIDTAPILRYNFMIEKCLENPNLITDLAEHLSTNSIEKICDYLFTNKKNTKLIPLFVKNFFLTYLKHNQSFPAFDLLMKTYLIYPDDFKLVLMHLIKNITIKSYILQEFMQNSHKELHGCFVSLLMDINITSDVFQHHINTINMVYRDYKKTENVQNFIQKLLIENSLLCVNDKNYGRLLLTFLQAQKSLGLTNSVMEKLVEQHKSPFRKTCLKILNEIK